MEYEKLKAEAATITMPNEMKCRIVRNCKTIISKSGKDIAMKTNRNNTFFRKPSVAFAAAVLCISLSVTAAAASGVLKGYFRDIKNWNGAIVGTSYEQATDEINLSVTVNGNELTVLATFSVQQKFPYREAQKLGIAEYSIVDAEGKVVKEGAAECAEVVNGQAAVRIALDDIDSGSYKLIVTAFVSEKKADQPLNINGNWECGFVK